MNTLTYHCCPTAHTRADRLRPDTSGPGPGGPAPRASGSLAGMSSAMTCPLDLIPDAPSSVLCCAAPPCVTVSVSAAAAEREMEGRRDATGVTRLWTDWGVGRGPICQGGREHLSVQGSSRTRTPPIPARPAGQHQPHTGCLGDELLAYAFAFFLLLSASLRSHLNGISTHCCCCAQLTFHSAAHVKHLLGLRLFATASCKTSWTGIIQV